MERMRNVMMEIFWFVLKGNKGKRVGVPSAKLAMLALITPHQFLENVWPKIVGAKNGLSDRILLFYQKWQGEIDLEEKIYIEHNGQEQYRLNTSAKEFFLRLCP